MSAENYELKTLNLKQDSEREKLRAFLETQDLLYEQDIDYALCLLDREKIIASGCATGNILKCIAVDAPYQGQSLTNKIISYLRLRAYHEGYSSLFLYTKPENERIFSELGFFLLARAPQAILMENTENACQNYLHSLESRAGQREGTALVMNCNPFTRGHLYLIEKACSENPWVHLFILREDLSVFPFKDRMELVRQGTQGLDNLSIHKGQDYIISRATFPSYFLKEDTILDENHARLDLDLFCRKIAPGLNITSRYVGEEPFCLVTAQYNKIMAEILPAHGIAVIEVPRKAIEGKAISASQIRKALAQGRLSDIQAWVPATTYAYLQSEKAAQIGAIIREKEK